VDGLLKQSVKLETQLKAVKTAGTAARIELTAAQRLAREVAGIRGGRREASALLGLAHGEIGARGIRGAFGVGERVGESLGLGAGALARIGAVGGIAGLAGMAAVNLMQANMEYARKEDQALNKEAAVRRRLIFGLQERREPIEGMLEIAAESRPRLMAQAEKIIVGKIMRDELPAAKLLMSMAGIPGTQPTSWAAVREGILGIPSVLGRVRDFIATGFENPYGPQTRDQATRLAAAEAKVQTEHAGNAFWRASFRRKRARGLDRQEAAERANAELEGVSMREHNQELAFRDPALVARWRDTERAAKAYEHFRSERVQTTARTD